MDYVERLREIHEGNERIDPSTYVDIVRRALRSAPANARELLQATYEKALLETYSSRAEGALGKVAQMGAAQMNAVGEHAGAVARLEQALQMAGEDDVSRAVILGERALYEALSIRPESGRHTRDLAVDALSDQPDVETELSVETTSAMVSLVLLAPEAIEQATAAIARARSNELDWMASAVMVFLVSALASSEDASQAVAWADALHGYAASLPHAARELDATVAQLALRARRRLVAPPDELDEVGRRTLNNIALWRLQILRTYTAAIRGESADALGSVAELEGIRAELNGGFTLASEGFAAFLEAHFGSKSVMEIPPPPTPTLLTTSSALASAEAIAIAGSQSAAADWFRWFETRLPETVATSLEWPSCRKRVEGLLLLRLGREREAVTRLQDGIRCCEARQDDIQAAIGRVQLSEALLRGSTASVLPTAHARSLRQSGGEELRALGVDPIPFAYAASRTFLQEDQLPERGGLTPREAQVLGRLARGLTGNDNPIWPHRDGLIWPHPRGRNHDRLAAPFLVRLRRSRKDCEPVSMM